MKPRTLANFLAKSLLTLGCLGLPLGVVFLGVVQPALANFRLAPLFVQMRNRQGQGTATLRLDNTSQDSINVRLTLVPFRYDENGKFQAIEAGSPWDLSGYLIVSPTELNIPGNSTRNVRLASLLPPSLPEGEYRTAVFAQSYVVLAEGEAEEQIRVGINASIGSAIYVRKGSLAPELAIQSAVLQRDPATDHLELRLPIENSGTATARTTIQWQLLRDGEAVVEAQNIYSFLPGHTTRAQLRSAIFSSPDFEPGTYQLMGELQWKENNVVETLPFEQEISW
jgi:hypothetical protein